MRLLITQDTYFKLYTYQISDPQTPSGSYVKVTTGSAFDLIAMKELVDEYGSHYEVHLSLPYAEKDKWKVFQGHCSIEGASNSTLIDKVVSRMRQYGYSITDRDDEYNIVAIRNMAPDGTPVSPTPNKFDDLLIVFQKRKGKYEILDKWICTTEPGKFWTNRPMNARGAARVEIPGQYSAWQVGYHQNKTNHEALIQTGGPVKVRRDANKDFSGEGDRLEVGNFGVNIHHGWNSSYDDIGRTSAGCTVIPRIDLQRQFMSLIKRDRRYVSNKNFVYTVTFLGGRDVASA